MKKTTTKNYYGVYENDKNYFDKHYKITMTKTTYNKTESGKNWRKKPLKEETKEILFEEYFNYLSSVEFFRNLGGYEKVEKNYTISGYIPTQLISISPEKDIKIVRCFKIEGK